MASPLPKKTLGPGPRVAADALGANAGLQSCCGGKTVRRMAFFPFHRAVYVSQFTDGQMFPVRLSCCLSTARRPKLVRWPAVGARAYANGRRVGEQG